MIVMAKTKKKEISMENINKKSISLIVFLCFNLLILCSEGWGFNGGRHKWVSAIAFSPNGELILSSRQDNKLKLWDVSTGKMIITLRTVKHFMISSLAISPDGKYVLAGSYDSIIKLWDISSFKEIMTFHGHNGYVNSVAISSDGKYALSGSSDSTLKLWDILTGKEIRTLELHTLSRDDPNFAYAVAFFPNGINALSANYDGTLSLWDVSTGREIRIFKGHNSSVYSVAISPDGKYALSGSYDNTLKLWDILTGRDIKTFTGHFSAIVEVTFSPGGKFALSGSLDNTLKLWNISSGKEVWTFRGHASSVSSLAFSPNGKYFASGSLDGTIRLWDISTKEEIVKMIGFENGEWIVITPEGYYNSSLNGHRNLNIREGNNVYGIDQFYDVFYRPDIVTAKLTGYDIDSLITLTIDDAINNPPPSVEFTSYPSDTEKDKVKICYQVKSNGSGIGEVRLFHNGKLIQSDGYYRKAVISNKKKIHIASLDGSAIYEDIRSILIKDKPRSFSSVSKSKGDIFEACREIELIPGENEISINAFNSDNTVQSYMKTIKVKSKLNPEEPHLYVFSIGINQYKDMNATLKYAAKDAKDFNKKVLSQSVTLYKPQNIHHVILINKDANKENILSKINELSKIIKPTDSFILYIAGHGVLLQNQFFILTHDYDGNCSTSSMISSNEIVDISKRVKSLRQLIVFDSCHAGGVDNIVIGLYDSRMSVLAKKMGLHIFTSANSIEGAIDGYNGNGLFTYTLLDGLDDNKKADKDKDGKISIVELGEYSKISTIEISKTIGHNQTPMIIHFGKDNAIYKINLK
jgi:WD40 repeat protein